MQPRSLLYVWVLLIAAGSAEARPQAVSPRAVLDQYCVTCHNQKLKTAGLMLDTADLQHPGASAEVWEKVLRKLRSGEMPPPGRPRPDSVTYAAMSALIEKALDDATLANPNP